MRPPYVNAALSNTPQQAYVGYGMVQSVTISSNNAGSSDTFVQFFDAASTSQITLGTTKPYAIIPIDQNRSDYPSDLRLKFRFGLIVAATTTPTGNVAPTTPLIITCVFQ